MTVAAPPQPVEPREGSRPRGSPAVAFLAALRPLQWVKNALVFVPPAAAHVLATPAALRSSIPVFVAFCAAASGGYLVNDRLDVASDRLHPRKRQRPFASGDLPTSAALLGPVLSVAGVVLATTVSMSAGLAVLVYALLSLAYSAVLKTRALVDVFTLALLYAMRLFGGAAATHVVPSPWLIGFSTFLFLGLAFIKRLSEPLPEPASAAASRRGYREGDRPALLAMGTACSFAACLVLALYVGSDMARSLYRTPDALWCLVPLLLFWQCRLWLAVTRGDLVDDPLPFALKDLATWLALAACTLVFWAAS